jgi:hypothetical protein
MKTPLAVASLPEDTNPRLRVAPPARQRTTKRSPSKVKDLGVVGQIRTALRPETLLATTVGFLLGGFVPLATFWLSHHELDDRPIYAQLVTYIVVGGLVYSAKTVFAWGKLAFQVPAKALGFVVLLEGVLIFSHTSWLSFVALAYLVGINGIATGCILALPKPTNPEEV